jgi:hypothetical protein
VTADDGFQVLEDRDLMQNSSKPLILLSAEEEWDESPLSLDQKRSATMDYDDSVNVMADPIPVENIPEPVPVNFIADYQIDDPVLESQSDVDDEDDVPISSEQQRQFDKFKIPWHKLPSDVIEDLVDKKRLRKRDMCLVANAIIADLRKINPNIRKDVLKRIADEAAAVYPNSFLPQDELGALLSTKPILLLAKLEARRNYLNRAPNKKIHSSQDVKRPVEKRRESDRIAASVQDYQPNIVGLEAGMRDQKKWLQNERYAVSPDQEQIKKYMEETYGLQRLDINRDSSVNYIREQWPYLFDELHLKKHFKQLTGSRLGNFSEMLDRSKGAIIAHLSTSKAKEITKVLPKIAADHVDVKALKLVCAHFKEDFKYVAQEFPVRYLYSFVDSYPYTQYYVSFHITKLGTSVQDLNNTVSTETPFIVMIGNFMNYFSNMIKKYIYFRHWG